MSTREEERPRGVQSVDRALDILELLAGRHGTLGVTEIAREVALPAGTAHRLLMALSRRGWVRQDPGRRYGVGPAALRVGDASSRELAALALPALRAAVEATGETANIAALEDGAMVYLAQAPSPHTLRIFAEVGRRVPLHSTAVGKVVLAGMDEARARALLGDGELTARTPRTLTTVDAVRQELQRVREQGYAVDDEEQELGVRCVAVPVGAGRWGDLALSVSGPVERMTREHASSVVPRLQQIADDLTHRVLGGL
ncbi:IclR family transcriptional regulator [Ornithinimicrobium pekingense]|uniref:IclR family transcriptional regulator n=1 Tax=Ornithinimicrobium pekingense TaxID=384677 RepID=A0ABQ2F8K0_9MICO|nr:IclR family transcriptional regulator [Ornithinimicrobium pekingense]GGK61810.1 IclR family transcriptional regulator [Ornithinimicrobium pekingense]